MSKKTIFPLILLSSVLLSVPFLGGFRSVAFRGEGGPGDQDERILLVALPVFPAVERRYHVLGLQRYCRWRNIRLCG